jgi:3-(3-hydroxy-phenyl)propionate hydroxylase
MRPGAPSVDAPVRTPDGQALWWLRCLTGDFTVLMFAQATDLPQRAAQGAGLREQARLRGLPQPQVVLVVPADAGEQLNETGMGNARLLIDHEGLLSARFGADIDTVYLLRPDQHVCARWHAPDPGVVLDAMARALGQAPDSTQRPHP